MKKTHNRNSIWIGIIGMFLILVFIGAFIISIYFTIDSILKLLLVVYLILLLWSIVAIITVLKNSVKFRMLQIQFEDKVIGEEIFYKEKNIIRCGNLLNSIYLFSILILVVMTVIFFFEAVISH